MTELSEALFSPQTIALVGASADPNKNNARPQRFLRKHGYTGRILPINPRYNELFGEPAYPDLASAPGPIDHAFVMVPAPLVPDVIAQCCSLRIPVATIFSAGFAELGDEGLERQRDMVAVARAAGVRLLGPNCMGLINVHGKTARVSGLPLERVLALERNGDAYLDIFEDGSEIELTTVTRLGLEALLAMQPEVLADRSAPGEAAPRLEPIGR